MRAWSCITSYPLRGFTVCSVWQCEPRNGEKYDVTQLLDSKILHGINPVRLNGSFDIKWTRPETSHLYQSFTILLNTSTGIIVDLNNLHFKWHNDSRHQDYKIVEINRPKNESLPTAQPHVYGSCHTICIRSLKYFPKMNGFSQRYMYTHNLAATVH